jgi:AcrR family transcriptional regulator
MVMTTAPTRLTRAHFIDAAARFIDEHGEQKLTMRRLGEILGVDQSAVYRHFTDRAALLDAVQGWLFEQFTLPTASEVTPRAQLRTGIITIRQVLMAHPHLALLTGRGVGLDVEVDAANWCLELLEQMGLSGHRRVVAYQMLESYVYGTSSYDAMGGSAAMELRRQWYRRMGRAETDELSRSVASIEALTDEAFVTGLDAVLEACERLAQS